MGSLYDQLPPRPPLKQHKEAVVDSALLDRYSGRYGVPPDLILNVLRDGNHLMIKEGAENHEMFAEGEHDFFSKTADDEITFAVDDQGRVTEMILHTGGQTMHIKRLQ
jgi:D-alanyl-D-alanine-carboxypeptidase/D-alanyl-D-alanine-endopeptidase